MARMRLNLASDRTTPSWLGVAPPDSPVPAPRATTGNRAGVADFQNRDDLRFVFR